MDDALPPALLALERGEHPAPPTAPEDTPAGALVAARWALALGLRPGSTPAPATAALVPLVDAWARERGWSGPGHRQLGAGLASLGFRRVLVGADNTRRRALALHREDAATLRRLVREAWAPQLPPGERRTHRRRDGRAPRRLRPTPAPLPGFHEYLATRRNAAPVVDSLGRVWPAPAVAALALGGSRKAVANAVCNLRALARTVQGTRPLNAALARGAAWRGVWWRHLTPSEVSAVPPGTPSGAHLPGLGWGLACPKCGACTTPVE